MALCEQSYALKSWFPQILGYSLQPFRKLRNAHFVLHGCPWIQFATTSVQPTRRGTAFLQVIRISIQLYRNVQRIPHNVRQSPCTIECDKTSYRPPGRHSQFGPWGALLPRTRYEIVRAGWNRLHASSKCNQPAELEWKTPIVFATRKAHTPRISFQIED